MTWHTMDQIHDWGPLRRGNGVNGFGTPYKGDRLQRLARLRACTAFIQAAMALPPGWTMKKHRRLATLRNTRKAEFEALLIRQGMSSKETYCEVARLLRVAEAERRLRRSEAAAVPPPTPTPTPTTTIRSLTEAVIGAKGPNKAVCIDQLRKELLERGGTPAQVGEYLVVYQ